MKSKCETCHKFVEIGEWPFCPHGSMRPERAQRFKPIVVFKDASGKYRFPASSDAPTPSGYQRVEITNERQALKLEREVGNRIKAEAEPDLQREREGWNQFWRNSHRELRERAKSFTPEGQRAVEELIESHRSSDRLRSFDPGFHIDIMHNNLSNREPHDDARTGWKTVRE